MSPIKFKICLCIRNLGKMHGRVQPTSTLALSKTTKQHSHALLHNFLCTALGSLAECCRFLHSCALVHDQPCTFLDTSILFFLHSKLYRTSFLSQKSCRWLSFTSTLMNFSFSRRLFLKIRNFFL